MLFLLIRRELVSGQILDFNDWNFVLVHWDSQYNFQGNKIKKVKARENGGVQKVPENSIKLERVRKGRFAQVSYTSQRNRHSFPRLRVNGV